MCPIATKRLGRKICGSIFRPLNKNVKMLTIWKKNKSDPSFKSHFVFHILQSTRKKEIIFAKNSSLHAIWDFVVWSVQNQKIRILFFLLFIRLNRINLYGLSACTPIYGSFVLMYQLIGQRNFFFRRIIIILAFCLFFLHSQS